MILILALLALTVPSDPRPKNIAWCAVASSAENSGSTSKLWWLTSSLMPTLKCNLGSALPSSAKTAAAIAGVNSFEDSPKRPPITLGAQVPSGASRKADCTSRYSGSPTAPGSLQRSSTARERTVGGRSGEHTSELQSRLHLV